MDSYPCPTELIAAFHSLSDSGTAMDGYSNIILMISCHIFFFNRNIACSSSVSAFIANTSNLIMKFAVFFFPCLKDSILYLASTAFVLSLNIVLISLTNSSQSWVSNFLFSSSSFFYTYIPATFPLRHARITVILLSVSMTLLLLRNNLIPLHQSSNFFLSLLNYPGSGTIFLGMTTCSLVFVVTGTGATDITSSDHSIVLSKVLVVIYKDPSHSDSASMLSVLLELILVLLCSLHHTCFVYCLAVTLPNFVHRLTIIHLSCKMSSSILYQMLQP